MSAIPLRCVTSSVYNVVANPLRRRVPVSTGCLLFALVAPSGYGQSLSSSAFRKLMFVWQLARQIGTHRGWPAADLTEVSHLRSCEHAQQGRLRNARVSAFVRV